MKRIIYGNKNFGMAPIDLAVEGAPKFGKPLLFENGTVNSEAEIEQSSSNIFADDIVWVAAKGAKVRSLKLAFRYIDESYLKYLGFKTNTNGVVTDTGTYENHCVFFMDTIADSSGKEYERLHYFYNVVGAEPGLSTTTKENEIEAQEIEVNYTCYESDIAVDDDGKKAQYGFLVNDETNKELFAKFKEQIILPKEVTPANLKTK